MRLFRRLERFGTDNAASNFCSDYGTLMVSCFENFTDSVNLSALAYMINTGDNLCDSAYRSNLLRMKQGMTFEDSNNLVSTMLNWFVYIIIFVSVGSYVFVATIITQESP